MKRKILLSIIGILIIICTIFLSYEKINKEKVNNNTGMFAIFLEEEKDSGKYQRSNLKTWPTEEEYVINMFKSYCENGSVLRWNNETKKLSLKVRGTDKCYVYFDKSEIGSKKHPHLIQTIEDLVRLSNDVNGGKTYEDEYFLLTNDLDFNDPSDYEDSKSTKFGNINGINGEEALITELTTGSGFIPIGKVNNNFQGNFDGGNKKIANLYIANNEINSRIGLFGNITDNSISNLEITGNITSKVRATAGGIIGGANGKINVYNVVNRVNVISESNEWDVGGIIGANFGNTNLKKAINYGSIQGANNTGGLVGYTNLDLNINESINNGSVQGGSNTGGLVGYTEANLNINESINNGIIINNIGNQVGGFIGLNLGTINIKNSYNTGKVVNTKTTPIGGIIGLNMGTSIVMENTYNTGNIVHDNVEGGMIGGLLGHIAAANDSLIILKGCYNLGTITNGSRAGGLVGDIVNKNDLILYKCYNKGDIISESINQYGTSSAGLVGAVWNDVNIYIINSYNEGNIMADNTFSKNGHASGLIGFNGDGGALDLDIINIINSYNKNNIDARQSGIYVNGIINLNGATGNFYNIYSASNAQSVVGPRAQTKGVIVNVYFQEKLFDNSNKLGIIKTEDYMKSQSFVEELNANIINETTLKNVSNQEEITLEQINPLLKDYTLSKWTLGSDGYPTLINE